jgi:hypothetical protein
MILSCAGIAALARDRLCICLDQGGKVHTGQAVIQSRHPELVKFCRFPPEDADATASERGAENQRNRAIGDDGGGRRAHVVSVPTIASVWHGRGSP